MTMSVLDDLKRAYHRTWWALMLNGLLGLAVGIVVLVRPLDSVAVFALLIAFWALFSGFVDIIRAFELRRVLTHWWVLLIGGGVGVGFGVLALIYYPGLSLAFAVVWVALWLTLIGAFQLYASYRLHRDGMHWGWSAVFGGLGVIAGVFALVAPPATLAAIMALIAGFGIVAGLALIVGAFKLRAAVHG